MGAGQGLQAEVAGHGRTVGDVHGERGRGRVAERRDGEAADLAGGQVQPVRAVRARRGHVEPGADGGAGDGPAGLRVRHRAGEGAARTAAEGGQAGRGAEARGAVVAGSRGAQVRVGAGAVGPGGDVVQPRAAGRVRVGVGIGARAGRARQRVGGRDHRGGRAGAAVALPAGAQGTERRVDGNVVSDRRHVGDTAPRAAGVLLELRFGLVRRTARARAVEAPLPHGLVPAARAAWVGGQIRAADRRHGGQGGRERDAVAVVTARRDDRDTGVVVGGPVHLLVRGEVTRAAVGVGDVLGAQLHGLVDTGREPVQAVVVRLHEQDVRTGGDGGDHVEVEGDLTGPHVVRRGIVRAAALVDLLEAAVVRGARRQTVLGAVDRQVRLGVGVVVRVDDGDGLSGAAVGREAVGALQVLGAEPRRRLCRGQPEQRGLVGAHGVAGRVPLGGCAAHGGQVGAAGLVGGGRGRGDAQEDEGGESHGDEAVPDSPGDGYSVSAKRG